MKKTIFISLIFLNVFSGFLWAESGNISYLEGLVTLERSGRNQSSVSIGDTVGNGDTLYTSSDSFVEIEMSSGSIISIKEDSIFNFGEISDPESDTRKRGFLRVLLGSVSFKLRNLLREPDIGTPLAVCSVRGTDFTVFTAPDGASMTVVSDGLVEVSAGGNTTLLAADQGIEIVAGLGLGDIFDAKHGFVRYDAFVKQALARLNENPAMAIDEYTGQLQKYIEEGEYFLKSHDTNMAELIAVRTKVQGIRDTVGDEAASKFIAEKLGPLQERGFELNTTYRHYLISAFFLRRYVVSSIYVQMRTRYLTDSENTKWKTFSSAYNMFLKLYEEQLIPLLEDEDL